MSNPISESDPLMTIERMSCGAGGPLVELSIGGVRGHLFVMPRAMQTVPMFWACALGVVVGRITNSPDTIIMEIMNSERSLFKVVWILCDVFLFGWR